MGSPWRWMRWRPCRYFFRRFFFVLAHRPEYAPQSAGVRVTVYPDRLVFNAIIQSRMSSPGCCYCCRGHADGRCLSCCCWLLCCVFAAGRRVLRVLLPGACIAAPVVIVGGAEGKARKSPLLLLCGSLSLFLLFACSAVLLLFRAEAKAAIALLLLALRLSAWSPGPVCWFIFLTLYVACRVPVFVISIFIKYLRDN